MGSRTLDQEQKQPEAETTTGSSKPIQFSPKSFIVPREMGAPWSHNALDVVLMYPLSRGDECTARQHYLSQLRHLCSLPSSRSLHDLPSWLPCSVGYFSKAMLAHQLVFHQKISLVGLTIPWGTSHINATISLPPQVPWRSRPV